MLGESSVSFSLLVTAGAGGVIIYLNGGVAFNFLLWVLPGRVAVVIMLAARIKS
jgi:hypothetical protein